MTNHRLIVMQAGRISAKSTSALDRLALITRSRSSMTLLHPRVHQLRPNVDHVAISLALLGLGRIS